MSERVWFATFGDTKKYSNSVRLICDEAREMDCFDVIKAFNETNLSQEFYSQHNEFLTNNRRGFGYWLWKPQVVKQCFDEMKENDILVYADCGCRLNTNHKAKQRMQDYIDLAKTDPRANVSFPLVYSNGTSHIEQKWTKMDLLQYFDQEHWSTAQLVGGIFVIRKCPFTVSLVDEWYQLGVSDGYHFINDSPSVQSNHLSFSEHRHDQSIWSLVRKARGSVTLSIDETWFPDFHNHMDTPIHAVRRTG